MSDGAKLSAGKPAAIIFSRAFAMSSSVMSVPEAVWFGSYLAASENCSDCVILVLIDETLATLLEEALLVGTALDELVTLVVLLAFDLLVEWLDDAFFSVCSELLTWLIVTPTPIPTPSTAITATTFAISFNIMLFPRSFFYMIISYGFFTQNKRLRTRGTMNNFLRKSELLLGVIAFGVLSLTAMFLFPMYGRTSDELPFFGPIFRIGGSIIIFASIMTLRWLKINLKRVLFYLFILGMVGLQILYLVTFKLNLTTDIGYVFTQAERLASGNNTWLHYFVIYPNNLNIAVFWAVIFKAFTSLGFTNHLVVIPAFQLIMLDLALVFLAVSAEKYRTHLGKWTVVIGLAYFPLTMYTMFVYNDLISVALLMISMGILLRSLAVGISQKRIIGLTAVALIFLIMAVMIRNNLVVVLIAMLSMILISSRFKWISKVLLVITAITFYTAGSFGSDELHNRFEYQPVASQVTPTMRYINMAWNPNTSGEIDGTDAWKFSDLPSDERSKKLFHEFKSRISQLGIVGVAEHLVRKTAFMFSIGFPNMDFGLLQFTDVESGKNWQVSNWIRTATNLFQPFYVLVLSLSLIAVQKALRKRNDDTAIDLVVFSSLAVLGIMAFQIGLWEVRDRYAVPAFPFFILLSAVAITEMPKQRWWTVTDKPGVWTRIVLSLVAVGMVAYHANETAHDFETKQTIVTPVKNSSYFLYSGENDYELRAHQKFETRFALEAPSQELEFNFGWGDPAQLEKVTITLINTTTKQEYHYHGGPSVVHFNDHYRPGKYRLIINTNDLTPTNTYLVGEMQTAQLDASPVTLNGKKADGLAIYYKFSEIKKAPVISETHYDNIHLFYILIGALVVIYLLVLIFKLSF